MLKALGHHNTIHEKIGRETTHQGTETNIGVRFISHRNEERRSQITHTLAVTNGRMVQCVPESEQTELVINYGQKSCEMVGELDKNNTC